MNPRLRTTTAVAAMVGGAILAVHSLAHWALYGSPFDLVEVAQKPDWILLNVLLLAGMILLLLGLVGLHERQAQRAGLFGLIAFLVLFVGFALRTGLVVAEVFLVPSVARQAPDVLTVEEPPLEFGLFFLVEMATKIGGLLLFGIATIRARVFPAAAGYVLVGGIVVSAIPGLVFLGVAIGGSTLAWMGWHHLVTTRSAHDAPAPMPASSG